MRPFSLGIIINCVMGFFLMSLSSLTEFTSAADPCLSSSGSELEILTAIRSAKTLVDVRNACFDEYMRTHSPLPEDATSCASYNFNVEPDRNICQAILDWHIEKMSDPAISPEALVRNLNVCMECVGCSPLEETNSGPHSDEQVKLRDLILARVTDNIKKASSGDVINMYLREMKSAFSHLNVEMGQDDNEKLADIARKKAPTWDDPNRRVLGLPRNFAFA